MVPWFTQAVDLVMGFRTVRPSITVEMISVKKCMSIMARVPEMAYCVGMGRNVADHCGRCVKCQITKAPRNKPAPLQPVIARKPWEMVAVDILKVPMSIYIGCTRLLFQVAICPSNS